ncbi:endonuclease III [Candidatus Woesearchaeota archaeon]|nr:endonuclease III [Candidatus Woesearchaeota archaeon]
MKKNIPEIVSKVKEATKTFTIPIVTEISWERNPFKVLISCLLSLRTRDSVTAKVCNRLFKIADTPEKLVKVPIKKLESLIYSVNFYKGKAERIHTICKIILEKYHGNVPDTMEELLTLKGVGRKTAGITLVYGFRQKEIAIPADIHVHRTANRIGLVQTKFAEQTEQALLKIVPKQYWWEWNDMFVKFGQNICLPRNPRCHQCHLTKYCKYYKKSGFGKAKGIGTFTKENKLKGQLEKDE